MTRSEAITLAKQLSDETRRLFVVFDKQLNDFFISEGEGFSLIDEFYETIPYDIIDTF